MADDDDATGLRYIKTRAAQRARGAAPAAQAASGASGKRTLKTVSGELEDVGTSTPGVRGAEFIEVEADEPQRVAAVRRRRAHVPVDQLDFFPVQLMDAGLKNDLASMEHPLFSLSKNPDTDIRHYTHNGNSITIMPSVRGMATIWDKDVLLYAASALSDALNAGGRISRTIRMRAYDLLRYTGRGHGKRAYDLLQSAFERLKGTNITTDIVTGGKRKRQGFGLIESWRIVEQEEGNRMAAVELTLSQWFFDSIVSAEVLTMNRDYFKLTSGLERRFYELARKHVGYQAKFTIGLATLHKKSGSRSTAKEFARQARAIVENNGLPDYTIEFDARSRNFTFRPRAAVDETVLALPAGDVPNGTSDEGLAAAG